MTENIFYVYIYKYPDGTPYYVGKGSKKRYARHLLDAKANRNQKSWCVRVTKKIIDSDQEPIIEKVFENLSNENALKIEKELIKRYGRRDNKTGILTNLSDGGESYPTNLSENIAREQSKRMLGKNNPMYGKKHSEEIKQKLREINTGKTLLEETKEKIKNKMSGRHSGEKNPFYGKKHSDESKEKISLSSQKTVEELKKSGKNHWNKGKKMSEDTIKKLKEEKTCNHCGKIGRGSAMNRYHFSNCKVEL
jgi:hypothetical protein